VWEQQPLPPPQEQDQQRRCGRGSQHQSGAARMSANGIGVAPLLRAHGLGQYVQTFAQQEVDLAAFLLLTEADRTFGFHNCRSVFFCQFFV
jgi:hypothetical protein